MAPPRSFAPRPAIRVLAGVLAVAALGLCQWQVRRDGERNAGREQALVVADLPPLGDGDPVSDAVAWRTVRWTGRFVAPAHLVAGTQHGGERGYDVVQVFVRADGARVLADRGWIPADAADATVTGAESVAQPVLTGQLRPTKRGEHDAPIEGHGTRIWQVGALEAAAVALDATRGVFVQVGSVDGTPLDSDLPIGGFQHVPDRDDTSLHYASQWLAVAVIGLLFAFPGPLQRALRKVGASAPATR